MSGSHFGSGYFPDDYFGLYFQPDSGGVIVGDLSGSFAGTSEFSGSLVSETRLGGRFRRRRIWLKSADLVERERHLEALRRKALRAIKNKELAFGSEFRLSDLAKDINAEAAAENLPQPFNYEREARLMKLVELVQQIDVKIALLQVREDEEEEEILLLAA